MHAPRSTNPDLTDGGAIDAQRHLDALAKIIEVISSELEFDDLLALILEHACTLIGADDGTIGLYDGARKVVRTAAVYHMPAAELGVEMKTGQGLSWACFGNGPHGVLPLWRLARDQFAAAQ